jgi:hypothetical protein
LSNKGRFIPIGVGYMWYRQLEILI